MSIIKSKKNKSISHRLKRALAFSGWRRNISAKEKLNAKESRKIETYQLAM